MKRYRTEEVLESIIQSGNFVSHRKGKFFKKTIKRFEGLKGVIGKYLNIKGSYYFDNIYLPLNELIQLLSQKESWTKEELDLLDEEFSYYSLKFLIKKVGEVL